MKIALMVCLLAMATAQAGEKGFVPLYNGKDLTGWHVHEGKLECWQAEGNLLVCTKEGGGWLTTDKEYADYILRLDWKITPGGNSGVGLRYPSKGNPSHEGMEIQILDDLAPEHKNLKPAQYTGSIYYQVARKGNPVKPVGEWNHYEITCKGPLVIVNLNGEETCRANMDEETIGAGGHLPLSKRPRKGFVGLQSHSNRVEFRNIFIKEIAAGPQSDTGNAGIVGPPAGFTPLFNGKDLTGWKGLVADPIARAKMSPEKLAAEQAKADEDMRAHWKAEDGLLVFDGHGQNLCTAKDYKDFEMLVDWKIPPKGDSGIYLRGSPQVQIWDYTKNPEGSGGLYNNKSNSHPTVCADNPIGEWNHFYIKMVGEKVWVDFNGKRVVDGVTLENYWDRKQPIFPTGQIELQNHGDKLWFRNIFIRKLS